MLSLEEGLLPDGIVAASYAVFDGDIEATMRREAEVLQPGLYDQLRREAGETVGSGKPLVARYVATGLVNAGVVPPTISSIITNIRRMVQPDDGEIGPEGENPGIFG